MFKIKGSSVHESQNDALPTIRIYHVKTNMRLLQVPKYRIKNSRMTIAIVHIYRGIR
jgi:hypothetical protein